MEKLIKDKMKDFYNRFNIKKELNEEEKFDRLSTRLKDTFKMFKIIDWVPERNDYFVNIIMPLNEYYGFSRFDDNDEEFYIDEANEINELLEFVQLYISIFEVLISNGSVDNTIIEFLIKRIKEDFEMCRIDLDVIITKKGYNIVKIGAQELDEKLVIDNLIWLSDYEKAYIEYAKALDFFVNNKDIRTIIDTLRLCVETFLKEFFNTNKHFEKLKPLYRDYLKSKGINKEIREMFETMLVKYKDYNNQNVKHNNNVYKQEVEFLIYQTGVFLRMFITLHDVQNANLIT